MTLISSRQRAFVRVAIGAAVSAMAACGGAGGGGGAGIDTPCIATLTGAAATETCRSQVIGSNGVWSFTIGTNSSAGGFLVSASMDGTGALSTGTYALGSSMTGGVGVSEGSSQAFAANYQPTINQPLTGTSTLVITSFSTVSGQGAVLFPHGTLTSTCPPTSGSAAAASLTVTF